ncbi:MAG: hypothetical protein JXD21_00565 [Candidatus Omnitrophica bacterium]|nr:hypothetical protein [Candidatus Omnitrophota bacterium]
MEYALNIQHIDQCDLWDDRYQRIYFGDEFCNENIPSVDDTKRLMDFCSQHALRMTLVTPFLTDRGVDAYAGIVRLLSGCQGLDLEVVLNDWGFLPLCRESGVKISLGRLLTHQPSDPRLGTHRRPGKNISEKWQRIPVNTYFTAFMKEQHIERIELSNTALGVAKEQLDEMPFSFSLHVPDVYLTLTRYPLFSGRDRFKIFSGSGASLPEEIVIAIKNIETPIFIRKNAFFYKNPHFEAYDGEDHPVDRIVYTLYP